MRRFKIILAVLCVSVLVESSFARGPFYPESVPARGTRKLARGFLNTMFFWAEIPKEVSREWQNVDPLTGVCCGTGKGIYKGAQRFGTGVYEMCTFPYDCPAKYQPIVYPEVVMEDGYDWGAEAYYSQQRTCRIDH